jgi:hypothetical protein
MNTTEVISALGFKDTFMEAIITILEAGKFTPVTQPIAATETVIGEMTDMEKAAWTYLQQLSHDPLAELRNSPKNTEGCVVDHFCLLLVDKEIDCHFREELTTLRGYYETHKDEIHRDRELHKKVYSYMVGLMEDRLNVEIKQIGVREGYKVVVIS